MSDGLRVAGLTVRFGRTTAVAGVDLAVAPGEIVALVGPSGCGKTTLLRAVAGLEAPDAGTVRWDGRDLTGLRAERRGFGLMFQDHALFPHRRVDQNVAFGLRMQGRSSGERTARVAEVLGLVGLAGFGGRAVDTLSGGEAQRVALARALAPAPRLLMLDEPLGSLDRSLRDRLAHDVRDVLRRAGVAALHVTHDQEEAYAVADRLVVLRAGRVVRDGPAQAVWAEPGSAFVARFLGHRNVLEPAVAQALGLGDGTRPVVVREAALAVLARPVRRPGTAARGGGSVATAQVVDVRFRGATSRVDLLIDVPGGPPCPLSLHTAEPPPVGTEVTVSIDPAHAVPVDAEPSPPV